MEEIKNALLEVLEDMHPDEDLENCTTLVDGGILDSFDIVTLISEINEQFDVAISADKIVPENFNSLDALSKLVYDLMEEE